MNTIALASGQLEMLWASACVAKRQRRLNASDSCELMLLYVPAV